MDSNKYPRDQPPPYSTTEQNAYQGVGTSTYPPQQTVIVTGTPTVITTTPALIGIGGCPACRSGVMVDNFTCLGIFCAIFFFPIGIVCCMLMTEKRCTNCGASFG